VKTVHALDRAATVIGAFLLHNSVMVLVLLDEEYKL
jgi:hypothetical protein